MDRETLIGAIEQRKRIAERNNQAFVDLPYEIVGDAIALLNQEVPSKEELISHYGKMYKCKRCGLEWYQQTQKYCQECGRPVKWE